MARNITSQQCEELLRQLQDGIVGDCLIMLDDGHDIYMHQRVMAANAPCFYELAIERGAQLRSVLYLRVHDITNTSLRLIRKFIYMRRLIMPATALLPMLADGMILQVFDPNAINRFGNSPAADHYLVRYSTDEDTMMPPGTRFFEDDVHYEIRNHSETVQLVRDTQSGTVEVIPRVAWLGLVEYTPQPVEFFDTRNVPQGYDEAVLFEPDNEEQSNDDDFEMAFDDIQLCAYPEMALLDDNGNGAANNAPQEVPANAANRSELVNEASTSFNTGNAAQVRYDAPESTAIEPDTTEQAQVSSSNQPYVTDDLDIEELY